MKILGFHELLELIKLSNKRLVAVSLMCAILLFSPINFLKLLSLDNFSLHYKSWIGTVFLIATCILIAEIIVKVFNLIKNKTIEIVNYKRRIELLRNLTRDEKLLLINYMMDKTHTRIHDCRRGIIQDLEYKEILFRSSESSEDGILFDYKIQPWAWDYLNKRQNLLDL